MSAPEPFEPRRSANPTLDVVDGLKIISAQLAYLIEHLVPPADPNKLAVTYECVDGHVWDETVDIRTQYEVVACSCGMLASLQKPVDA